MGYFEFLIVRTTKTTTTSAATKISKCLSETKKIMEMCPYAALSALRCSIKVAHYQRLRGFPRPAMILVSDRRN